MRKLSWTLSLLAITISVISICHLVFVNLPRQAKLDEQRQKLMQGQQEIDDKLNEQEWSRIKWRLEKKINKEIQHAFSWLASYRYCGDYYSGNQYCFFGSRQCSTCEGEIPFKPGEICDGQDNNGNELIDEGCACMPENWMTCDIDGTVGIQYCKDIGGIGVWGRCLRS